MLKTDRWMIWLYESYHRFILYYHCDFIISFTFSFLKVYKVSQQYSFKLFDFFTFLLFDASLRKISLKLFSIVGFINPKYVFFVIRAFYSYLAGSIHCPWIIQYSNGFQDFSTGIYSTIPWTLEAFGVEQVFSKAPWWLSKQICYNLQL